MVCGLNIYRYPNNFKFLVIGSMQGIFATSIHLDAFKYKKDAIKNLLLFSKLKTKELTYYV